jgi:hypothetical protein
MMPASPVRSPTASLDAKLSKRNDNYVLVGGGGIMASAEICRD